MTYYHTVVSDPIKLKFATETNSKSANPCMELFFNFDNIFINYS